MHAGAGSLLLRISSDMSELLVNCTNVFNYYIINYFRHSLLAQKQAHPGMDAEVLESLK